MTYASLADLKAARPDLVEKHAESVRKEESRAALETERRKRTGVFTASEVHKLLTKKGERAANATSQSYTLAKAFEKLTGESARNSSGFIETEWGNFYENEAVNAVKMRFPGVTHTGDEQQFVKAKGFNFGATPDGLIGKDGVLEIKCPFNGGIHLENIAFGADLDWFRANRFDYFAQMQGEMWATDRKWCLFASYEPARSRERDIADRRELAFPATKQLHTIHIDRDEAFIENMKKIVEEKTAELEKLVVALRADGF
jgi:exodeoxyribonuclease (lambda-induced)